MPLLDISTRSECPFPYTYEDANLEAWLANNSLTFGQGACTQTFADFLDPAWAVFQAVMGLVSFTVLLVYIGRIVALRNYTRAKRTQFFGTIQGRLFPCGAISALAIFVEVIDPLGLRVILPPALYLILDEVIAGLLFTCALLIVDFWAKAAKGLRAHESGLPRLALYGLILLSFANFVGLQILGMLLPDMYFDFEAYKMFGGAAILILMAVVTWRNVGRVRRSLLNVRQVGLNSSDKENSSGLDASGGSGAANSSSAPGSNFKKLYRRLRKQGANSTERQNITNRIIAQLRSKNRKFFAIIAVTCIVLLLNGVLSITRPDDLKSMGYKVDEYDYYVTLVLLKSIYMIVLILILHFFHVPGEKARRAERNRTEDSFTNGDNSKTGSFITSARVPGETDAGTSSAMRSQNPLQLAPPAPRSIMSSFTRGLKALGFGAAAPRPSVHMTSIYDLEAAGWEDASDDELAGVLADPRQRAAYRDFLLASHATELLDCYGDIEAFEAICESQGARAADAQRAAVHVVSTYIDADATAPINISSGNRELLVHTKNSRASFEAGAFAKVKRELYETMREDTFARFQTQTRRSELHTPAPPPL